MKLDVLLTDGNYKHTYAAIRGLIKRKLKVGVISSSRLQLCMLSLLPIQRFIIKQSLHKEDNYKKYEIYKNELLKILKKNKVKVFLPIGNSSCKMASLFKEELSHYTKVPIVEKEVMEIAQNKDKTFRFAKKIGIPTPKTFFLKKQEEIEAISKKIRFPCVIKKANVGESGVIYCNNQNELKKEFRKLLLNKKEEYVLPIIQEYLRGPGVGFYGLFDEGKCKAFFMHKRIHEYPVTGGASSFAKSYYDEKLKNQGIKILEKLKWHGVAMVEFKKEIKTGKFILIEINPKFWGSLELSYKAGIDFPYLDYLLALNREIPKTNYNKKIYFKWFFPYDLLWLKFASKKQRKAKKCKKEKIYFNWYWNDPLINIYNIFLTAYKFMKDKRFPHGRIKK
jgi:predicted ATP-grasp superfamily ATP-dependent carboligase